jgi:hypothetical protein
MVIVTGRGKAGHHRYGCPQNYYRGVCDNRLKERADWIENRSLFELQRSIAARRYRLRFRNFRGY